MHDEGTIARPPGLRLDTGGTAKGLAADLAASLFGDRPRFFVDCAGDLRLRGGPSRDVFDVVVEHPLTGEPAATLPVTEGAVATSGLGRRLWRGASGRPAHHLLDPARGRRAWTGLVSATALAPSGLEAETLAKAALLRGPAGARELLGPRGGVLVHDDGAVERVGRPVGRRPRLRVRLSRPPDRPGPRPAASR